MSNRRSDDTFLGARNLPFNRIISDSLGQTDRVDFYQFRASGPVNFNLSLSGLQSNASVRLLNSRRVPIAVSNRPGNQAEQISARLGSGLYYVQVQFLGRSGTTRYNLRATATTPPVRDETLATAFNIGVLSTTYTRRESVGGNDRVDFYRFTLNDIANLQVRVNGFTSGTRFQLIRDGNNNRQVDNGEILASGSSFGANSLARATQDLPPGTYFIKVESTSTRPTQYQLNLIPTLFGGNVSPEPGNTLPLASNTLGVFSGTRVLREYVGPLDTNDFYRFTVNDLSNLQITRIGSSRDPEVRLIRDSNNNGIVDRDEVFLNDNRFAVLSDRASIDVPVGTYFIGVESRLPSSYEMTLVGTPYGGNGLPDPGNTLSTARDLGAISGTSSLKEYVGVLDPSDFYRFTVGTPVNLQARLTPSSGDDLDVDLIQDTNNNGLIDANEILRSGTTRLTRDLLAGTYFLRIEPRFSSSLGGNYALDLIIT